MAVAIEKEMKIDLKEGTGNIDEGREFAAVAGKRPGICRGLYVQAGPDSESGRRQHHWNGREIHTIL